MPIPLRVPVEYAFSKLNESRRGYQHSQRLNLDALQDITQEGLVRVTHLRPWFANNTAFQEFKRQIYVPHNYWQRALQAHPTIRAYARRQMKVNPARSPATSPRGSRRGSPRRSPPRSRSRTPPVRKTPRYRKGELKMTTRLGRFRENEHREVPLSSMGIDVGGDECDETDVNFPLPVCQAINKVCRRYSPTRQYMPYRPDGTEQKNYMIRVKSRFRN